MCVKLPLYYYPSGWLQYISPQSQTFIINQTVTMSVSVSGNIHDQFSITSLGLAWYHNGSRIEANDRIDISNNKTTLTISNTKDSDAGKYQVRIDSLTFGNHSYPECDQLLLPVLENYALHSPATFLLQQNALPNYSPDEIINNYFIPSCSGNDQKTFTINYTEIINSTLLPNYYYIRSTFKDGRFYSNRYSYMYNNFQDKYYFTYNINYQNSQDIVGYYIRIHYLYYYYYMQSLCASYFNYLMYNYRYIPFIIHYWTINIECKSNFCSYNTSSCVLLLQLLLSLPPPNQCLCC